MSIVKKNKISIIIPFRDKLSLTSKCVNSLYECMYKMDFDYEILLVNNASSRETLVKLKDIIDKKNTRILNFNDKFNFHKINNWAVQKTTGNILFFLNNDVEFLKNSAKLIKFMVEISMKKDIGAVGPLLLYPDGKRIQHAGVYLKSGGFADHFFIRQELVSVINNSRIPKKYKPICDRVVSAVTGAVMVVEKKKFLKVGGFDERFTIGGGDVDLCLRLYEHGYKTYYVGSKGYLIHHESVSRKKLVLPYMDFYYSYKSYIKHFDLRYGDKFISYKIINDI